MMGLRIGLQEDTTSIQCNIIYYYLFLRTGVAMTTDLSMQNIPMK